MFKVKVPTFPESISEGTLIAWNKQKGDTIHVDEVIAEIETDKVVFEVPAPNSGTIVELQVSENDTVSSEQVIAIIEASAVEQSALEAPAKTDDSKTKQEEQPKTNPAARKILAENDLASNEIAHRDRITKEDVINHLEKSQSTSATPSESNIALAEDGRIEKRIPMTRIRARIAERLLYAKQSTAMLTTFNEINMQPIMDLRNKHKEAFEKRHNVRLGFMSLFVKATSEALRRFPDVNASIDGDELVYHSFCDIGVAVSTERGLVVPILRDAESMSIAQIEQKIVDFSNRGRSGNLNLEEITGGTFSITNGGVFGSMLSTPILNPPQSAILGMHNIQKRPVVENDAIVIRPIMYLAVSYDHRIIDGKTAVSFLRTLKEFLEDPARMLLDI